jgi:hypothetical protein
MPNLGAKPIAKKLYFWLDQFSGMRSLRNFSFYENKIEPGIKNCVYSREKGMDFSWGNDKITMFPKEKNTRRYYEQENF